MNNTTEENLKWMYEGKNSSIDHEQYLLGKKITSLDDSEDKGDFTIKPQSSIATGNVTVLEKLDYESKVREDPLFEIRKNDYEHRKELLSNPLKKKRIQNLLKNALEKDLSKSLRNRTQSYSSSSSESDTSDNSDEVDEKLSKKYLKDEKLRKALKKKLEQDLQCHGKSKEDKREKSKSTDRVEDHKRGDEKRRLHRQKRSSSEDDKDKKDSDLKKTRKSGYGLTYVRNGSRESVATKPRKRRERSPASPQPEKQKYVRKHKSGFSRNLTEEELDRKRREMMDNASWRDNQRKVNIKKFVMEETREKEREAEVQLMKQKAEKKGGKVKDFLHNMKLHSATVGSLEDTVRRKKHTLSHKY